MNECEPRVCPDPEVLAAFVAGNLSGTELAMTVEHLRECEDCREIVADAARYDRSPEAVLDVKRKPRLPYWLITAAAIAGIGYFAVSVIRSFRETAPMRALVAAAPTDGRYVEPRVSGGFPWAPLRSIERGPSSQDPAHMIFVGEAGKVIAKTKGDSSAAAQHASAVARLLADAPGDAVTQLGTIPEASRTAAVWNDLAAALYTTAVLTEDSPKLAQALAAVDAALRQNDALPEALFNRALILERLGLRDQARAAWQRYLAVDSGSAWSHEAETHLAGLKSTSEFRGELDRAYASIDGDPTSVKDLVRRFPQDARVWGESEILKRWARCELDNDPAGAATHLRMARSIGNELVRRNGEGMLRDAVASIDSAQGSNRALLAAAHVALREAQSVYRSEGPAKAEPLFRDAAAKFDQTGSPMGRIARYFVANTVLDQRRFGESRALLESALAETHPEFKAHAAQVEWELGMAYASLGRWGKALDALQKSIAGFESLGETNYAMTVREILAEAYDRIGEPRKAWSHRIAALQELGRNDDLRLQVAIYAIARGAALTRDWPVALSFLNLQLEMGRHRSDELMYAHTLLLRASVEGRMGQESAALSDLAKATASLPAIQDAGSREGAEAERMAVEGMLARSPGSAIGILTRAIDFERSRDRRMFLPELLLQRGRSYARLAREAEAADDFEAGIRELESERDSIAPGDERWGMFGAADELFDEAVLLALRRGDAASALGYSERGRARELLDSMGVTAVASTPVALPDALILEYVQLSDRMIIFVVDGARVRVLERQLSCSAVTGEIESLIHSAGSGDNAGFRRHASTLYDRLLGPVADELSSRNTLVVVPDGTLALVPFGALIDPAGRYVIERRPVVITPSVTVLSRMNGSRKLGATPRLLMMSGPVSREGDAGALTAEQREIESVVAEYGNNVEYAPRSGAAQVLEAHAGSADVIHFVGHAIIPDEESGGALVMSRRAVADEQLDVREIASMHLRDIRVVVLAACGTARGHGRVGVPSISVARAFLVAGVPSVLATLWPVDDVPAAEFFPRFHHYVVRGLPPAEALRAVQLEWIHRQDVSPGVWAAVEIIGT